jgi:hypothetical protein
MGVNKRIKELAEQAGFMDYWFSESGDDCERELKQFAELIVRECIAQCEQVAAEADSVTKSEFVTDAGRMLHEGMWGGAKNCSGQIQTHFGVEE